MDLGFHILGASQPSGVACPLGGGHVAPDLHVVEPINQPPDSDNMAECMNTALPFVYDSPGEARDTIREVSSGTRAVLKDQADESRFVGGEFSEAAKDRADQDRYVAGQHDRNNHDRHNETRWLAREFESVKHDVLRAEGRLTDSDRRTELAVEKTSAGTQVAIQRESAATNLAIEKTAAATNLAIQVSNAAILLDAAKNAAAQALALEKCCCELKERIADDGEKTRLLVSGIERDALRAKLAVFEARVSV